MKSIEIDSFQTREDGWAVGDLSCAHSMSTKMRDEADLSSVQCFQLRRGQLIALNGIGELTSLFFVVKILAGCVKPMGENSVKWGCVFF